MSVSKIKATVFSQEQLASDVFSMWLEVGSIASEAKPGQFISVYSNDDSKLLPRPISICEIDKGQTENCVPCCWLWYKRIFRMQSRGHIGDYGASWQWLYIEER